jgi:phosphoglycerate dehydrogenase-like enzyme
VLITSYLEPDLVDRIRHEVPQIDLIYRPDLIGKPTFLADHTATIDRTPTQEAEWRALLAKADILFDFDHTHLDDLPELAPNVKWIQATSAGIGQRVHKLRYAERTNWIFTTASGVHARPLAEYCIMSMIMFAKNYQLMEQAKAAHQWQLFSNTELAGKTVGIIGLGRIGRDVATVCKFFGMNVIGTRRDITKPVDHVDTLYAPDELDVILPQVDYLVLATPHTPETEGLLSAERIRMIKRGAVVINVARGAVVDQPALIDALTDGHLLGAALDVVTTEPMPADDPLWDVPNVIISQHSACTADTENSKITDIFIKNLKHFINDEPMDNVLDPNLMY